MNDEHVHQPVLLDEVIEFINPRAGGLYVDCTLGGAGHAGEILKVGGGEVRLIGIDRDRAALERARALLKGYGGNVELHYGRHEELADILEDRYVDGILFDLGVSSFMIDDPARGFSFDKDGLLDMRMDTAQSLTAHEIINKWEKYELTRIFRKYGEEPFAGQIAARIVRERVNAPIESTLQLARIVSESLPYKKSRVHPATKIFQALRIAVNGELEELEGAILAGVDRLNPGGRMAIISFHSLEDRIAKRTFAKLAKGCDCPPALPQCVCGKKPLIKTLTKRPVTASERELAENPRSRSAKLRVAERIAV